MSRLARIAFALATSLPILASAPASAETIKVGSGAHPTIQSAIAAALANSDPVDTVAIPPGTYDESVFITITGANAQESLTLRRAGSSGVVAIGGLAGDPAIRVTEARGLVLKNLTVASGTLAAGGTPDGIAAIEISGESSDIAIENCTIAAGDDAGIAVIGPAASGVLVRKTSFPGVSDYAVQLDGRNHRVENCQAGGTAARFFVTLETSDNCSFVATTAQGNFIVDVLDPGLFTLRGTGHSVAACEARDGGSVGFAVFAAGSHLAESIAVGNAASGFHVAAQGVALENCQAAANVVGAIVGGAGVALRGGSYSGNSGPGVIVADSKARLLGITANNNFGNGVLVDDDVLYTQIRDSKFKNNGADGVTVLGDRSWLEGNAAAGGDGLVDSGADNAGRGNEAKGGATNDF